MRQCEEGHDIHSSLMIGDHNGILLFWKDIAVPDNANTIDLVHKQHQNGTVELSEMLVHFSKKRLREYFAQKAERLQGVDKEQKDEKKSADYEGTAKKPSAPSQGS